MATVPKKTAPQDFVIALQSARDSDWYEDRSDPRCPHDAWLSKLEFSIDGRTGNEQECKKTLQVVLLGAYHNGLITLTYRNVRLYQITLNREEERPGTNWRREDWLDDKVTMLEPNVIEHRINWETEAWLIEASEIEFKWTKIEDDVK